MKPDATIPASVIRNCAIYGWRRGDKYLYIGQSTKVLQRIMNHHIIDQEVEVRVQDQIDIWSCWNTELDGLERRLIKEFDPPLNKKVYDKESGKQRYRTFKEAAEAKAPLRRERIKTQYGTLRPLTDEEQRIVDSLREKMSAKPQT